MCLRDIKHPAIIDMVVFNWVYSTIQPSNLIIDDVAQLSQVGILSP